jgi:hypothetical protein
VRVDGTLGTQPRDIHRNRKIVLKHASDATTRAVELPLSMDRRNYPPK